MSLRPPSPRRQTNQGTRTLKAAYAQAQRDVKRMDPAVLAAVGRSKLNGNQLKHLAHANINGMYGSNQKEHAKKLNAQAAKQIQATTPASQRTRNPFKKLSNRKAERKDIRQGRLVLEMAYAQAKSEVKRIDPAVRQAIGHSRITKHDLSRASHSQLGGAVRAGIEQAAQHHYAQARASAAAVAAQPARQSAGQRVANAVNTASRWTQAVRDGASSAKGKAEKFRADYNERRQNPTTRGAQPAVAAQTPPDLAAQKAALAKAAHAGLNQTVPLASAAATGPTTGTGTGTGQQTAQPGPQQTGQQSPQQGAQPAAQQGVQPGAQPGAQQGAPQGVQPGVQPGAQQGAPQGVQPGVQPGAQQGAPQGVQAGAQQSAPQGAEATAEAQEPGNGRHRRPETGVAFDGVAPAGRVSGSIQVAANNSGPVVMNQQVAAGRQPEAGGTSGQFEWGNGNSPTGTGTGTGADPAMAPASGATKTTTGKQTSPTGQQTAPAGQQGEAAATHNKHRKPEGHTL